MCRATCSWKSLKSFRLRTATSTVEGNSAAHLKSTLFGCSTNVIVADGQLCLGTWQSVFFCEFDGPRERSVWVQVTGT